MLDFEEKALCRKVAGVLELAAIEGYEPIAFTKLWLSSKTAYNLYIWDFKDIAQSKQYLLHSIEIEYRLTEEDKQNNEELYNISYFGKISELFTKTFLERTYLLDGWIFCLQCRKCFRRDASKYIENQG